MGDLEPDACCAGDEGDQVELRYGQRMKEGRERHAGQNEEADKVGDQQELSPIPPIRVDADDQSEQQEGHELKGPDDAELER